MISASKLRHRILVLLFILAGAFLFAGRVMAQDDEAGKMAASLPPESRAVIERLASLHALPDGAWKIHSGDLAHGEAVNLDESSWQPIAVQGKAGKEAVWFRQTYQVPTTLNGYDLSGARIWFEFHARANGPIPEILYFNGRRVAMGDDLEPVVLFDDARPGDKVTVAVKLLHTVDTKSFNGATALIPDRFSEPFQRCERITGQEGDCHDAKQNAYSDRFARRPGVGSRDCGMQGACRQGRQRRG
ncbi:MAG: hypothetical protein ABSC47_13935 [Terracidiphilus sp.]|jgi:alpha-mannosidase